MRRISLMALLAAALLAGAVALWSGVTDARSLGHPTTINSATVGDTSPLGQGSVRLLRFEAAESFPGREGPVRGIDSALIVLAVVEWKPAHPDEYCEVTLHAQGRRWDPSTDYAWQLAGVPEEQSCYVADEWVPGQTITFTSTFDVPADVAYGDLQLQVAAQDFAVTFTG